MRTCLIRPCRNPSLGPASAITPAAAAVSTTPTRSPAVRPVTTSRSVTENSCPSTAAHRKTPPTAGLRHQHHRRNRAQPVDLSQQPLNPSQYRIAGQEHQPASRSGLPARQPRGTGWLLHDRLPRNAQALGHQRQREPLPHLIRRRPQHLKPELSAPASPARSSDDLPIPCSPSTSTSPPTPADKPSSKVCSRVSSSRRPTNNSPGTKVLVTMLNITWQSAVSPVPNEPPPRMPT